MIGAHVSELGNHAGTFSLECIIMSGLLDGLMQHLDSRTMQQVGTELGTDPAATQSAVSTAMPVLLAALARNASSPTGANALAGALDRDHASAGLGDIASMLGGAQGGAGQKILGHILGGGQPAVAQSLGAATGLDSGRTMKLLVMLAPVVLAYLARQKQEKGLDAGGLGSMLGTERDRLQAQAQGGGALGGLMSMLDRDKDGSVVDDVGGMVGKMFGR